MARAKRTSKLDEAIAQTAPGQPPRPDFQVWRTKHADALAALKRQAQKNSQPRPRLVVMAEFGRAIMTNPISKLAVAAGVIVAIVLFTARLTGREAVPPTPNPVAIEPVEHDHVVSTHTELAQADTLFASGDIAGLLALLETGQDETRARSIEYLGQLGDPTALPALRQLTARWQDAPRRRVVEQAIDQILLRQEQLAASGAGAEEAVSPDVERETPAVAVGQAESESDDVPDQIVYAGRVVDEAGQPVAGVRVWGFGLSDTLRYREFAEETVTDLNGRYLLATVASEANDKERMLRFDHPDHAMGWHTLQEGESPGQIDVALCAPGKITGTVVDAAGDPIPNATVEAEVRLTQDGRTDDLLLMGWTESAIHTDSAGRFALERLPVGSSLHLKVSAEGYMATSTAGMTVPLAGERIPITLEPGQSIRGRIVYEDGRSYHDRAVIVLDGPVPNTRELVFVTDDEGCFISPGLSAGLYNVNAMAGNDKMLTRPAQVQVESGSDGPEVVLSVLPEGVPVRVQTVDETTGLLLADVPVWAALENSEGTLSQARTDERGECILEIPPGPCRIEAQGWKNGQFASFGEMLTVQASGTEPVRISMTARAKIAGRLVDLNGAPIEGTVQLGSDTPISTDSQGWFVVDEPFGDAFEYHALWAYDLSRQMARLIRFRTADYTGDLVIALEPCATVTGRILNPLSEPVTHADIRLGIEIRGGGTTYYHRSKAPWTVYVDANGVFVYTEVPVGLSLVAGVVKQGLVGTAKVPPLVAGQSVDMGDIVLHGTSDGIDEHTDWTGILTGTITNEVGTPIIGVRVKAYTGQDLFDATTDSYGHYTLTGLPKGVRLDFDVYLAGYGHSHKYVFADSDDGDMQLFPQGWELLGKKAPPLSIAQWFNSDPVTLDQLRGRVVLLQVGVLLPLWGNGLTLMQEMSQKYGSQGLEAIAIHQPFDVDWAGEVTEEDIALFLQQQEAPFIFCLEDGQKTWAAYQVKATPALYLIDKQGNVRISPAAEDVEEWIRILLAE